MPWHDWQDSGLVCKLDALAGGQVGVEVGGQRGDGLRRRPQRPAEDAPRQEHPAVDRRAGRRVGEAAIRYGCVRMPDRSPGVQLDLPERRVGRQVHAVERRQPAVEVEVLGQQELAEVGGLAADDVVEEQLQRVAQVGDRPPRRSRGRPWGPWRSRRPGRPRSHWRRNSRSLARARRSAGHAAGPARRPARGVASRPEAAASQQRPIRDRVPQPEREPGRHVEGVRRPVPSSR